MSATLDSLALPHVRALCAAVDTAPHNDTAAELFAALGLSPGWPYEYQPVEGPGRWTWSAEGRRYGRGPLCAVGGIGEGFFERLLGGELLPPTPPYSWARRRYPSRSAAFLALAEALSRG